MKKSFALMLAMGGLLWADYKVEPAGAPPSELAPAIQQALQKQGAKIVGSDGTAWCEIWFREAAPAGKGSDEMGVTLKDIPLGSLVGAIRFPGKGADRRGQVIPPGVYTLRFELHPVDGAHQGVAEQRDFLVMSPAAMDTDLNAITPFNDLMKLSAKATGTPHPGILETWKDEPGAAGKLEKLGENDWYLHAQIGDKPIAVILVGKAAEH